MRQLRFALRTLFKTPFVTTVAVLSLALGIGANAAIFSLFDQLLLEPLPVAEPSRLVNLGAPGPKPGSTNCSQAGGCDLVFSYAMFRDLERAQTVLTGLAAHVSFGTNLSFRDQPIRGGGLLVSGSYFPTLGIQPALGRLLSPADDQTIGSHFVAVLSYEFWAANLGADPTVLNQTITVNGQSMTIVGVAPKGFDGTTIGSKPYLFVPMTMRGLMQPGFRGFENRRSYFIYLFGRLKPGVSIEQAKMALNTIYKPILSEVEAPLQKGMSDQTLERFKQKEISVEPGQRGQSSVQKEAKTPLFMLFGITGIVLLIACANIANLLLARGAQRSMEMAVRLALGATRRQLLTQLMIESLVLALMGGIASLLVAKVTLVSIGSLMPPEAAKTIKLDLQPVVFVFSAALAIGTGLVFGLFPALNSTRPDLVTSIRSNAGQILGARAAMRFRATLVTVQIALSTALLISAGLFIKSLVNIVNVDLGMHVENVVTFSISPTLSGYDTTRSSLLFERVEQELAALPGVNGVTSSTVPLLAGSNWGNSVHVQGYPEGPDSDMNANYNEVGAGYLNTLGMQLVAGREFSVADTRSAARVAIVNEAFVKKFYLGSNAVGTFMSTSSRDTMNIQIVGVVKNAKYSEVKRVIPAVFFTPWRQDGRVGFMNFYVRSSQGGNELLRTIPNVMKRLDAQLPVERIKTMPQQIRENVFIDRLISILAASFAVLATLLAGIGLYGIMSYSVAQRTREIGVRMALGADARAVAGMVLRQVAVMLAIGGVVGVLGAVGIGRAAKSLLFELQGTDPAVYGMAVLMLTVVALAAGYLPARRAASVDPMNALRYD